MTEPLIEASRVKFAGMSSDSLEDPPKLDEARTYTVEATCTAITRERMKDGEMRLVAKMQVDELWEGSGPKPAAESEPGLFDENDDGSWDEDDTSHDTTGPLPLKSVADPFGGKG
jgi:hypothetical protein